MTSATTAAPNQQTTGLQDLLYVQLRLDQARKVTVCSEDCVRLFDRDITGMCFDKLIARTDRVGHAAYMRQLVGYDEARVLDVFASLAMGRTAQLCRIRMRKVVSEWTVVIEVLHKGDPVRALLESREHQRAAIRGAAEGIAFLDDETGIVEHNLRFFEICDFRSKHGVPLNEASILGRRFVDIANDHFQAVSDAFDNDSIRERTFDDRIYADDKILHVMLTPTFIGRDMFGGYVLSIEDLTSEEELNRLRIESARNVGQAEIATSILHNVGNSLNSLSIGHEVLATLAESPLVTQLDQAVQMLDCENPSEFLKSDLGSKCVPCLRALVTNLLSHRDKVNSELSQFSRHIEHIRAIVAKQQAYAKSAQVLERCLPNRIFEDALEMALHQPVMKGISLEKCFNETNAHEFDRHRALEILVNLITNATDAVMATDSLRLIAVSTELEESGFLVFSVRDSGIGISREDQQRVFQRGFTTKDTGHGFGLHSCACIAGEMGGSLSCFSEGPGTGARFDLRIPVHCAPTAEPKMSRVGVST